MKKFALYLFSAVLILYASAAATEFLTGTSNAFSGKSFYVYDFYKVSEEEKTEVQEYTKHPKAAELTGILSEIEIKHYRTKFAPVRQSDMKYEISTHVSGEGFRFIFLGNVNVFFEDYSKGGYEIVNAEEIIAKIDALLEEKGE